MSNTENTENKKIKRKFFHYLNNKFTQTKATDYKSIIL